MRAIGIVQELRAKRTLDRLAVLNAPRARVVRDGAEQDVPVADVVLDDLLAWPPGDQVPADGVVPHGDRARGRRVAAHRRGRTRWSRQPGTRCGRARSSSSGRGRVQATAVGEEAYAARLATEARRFTTTYSELVAGTNRLLRWIAVALARRRPGGAVEPDPHAPRTPGGARR